MEIWKTIEGYEDYQVSNLGRVKSLKWNKEKILKPAIDKVGYYCVVFSKNGIIKTFKVHQLVAIAFLNHKPCGYKLVVNHINFNKIDNSVKNLEIVTSRENTSLKHIKSSSIYTGVCWSKRNNKWVSYIRISNKFKHLGYFDCELEANKAYQNELNNIS